MSDEATAMQMGLPGLAAEEMPSLADFADEPSQGGAWPKGWYRGKVVAGYSTRGGKQYLTEDSPSKDGASRNLWLCVSVRKGTDTRNIRTNQNYRPDDFSAGRLQLIKAARDQHKGEKAGKWAGQEDIQRSSISIGQLGAIEKAFGFGKLLRHPQGHLIPGQFIDQDVDVYLNVDEKGYNEIKEFAEAGSKAKG